MECRIRENSDADVDEIETERVEKKIIAKGKWKKWIPKRNTRIF